MDWIIVGVLCIIALALWFLSGRRHPAPSNGGAVYYDEDDDYYAPIEDAHKEEIRSMRFSPGCTYLWEPIEDLLWAYGYMREEVHEMWKHNYIEIYRDGLIAAFDGSLFGCDKQGNQLYVCHRFDPQADTSDVDRWRRQPTDAERQKAVWQ